MTNPMTQGSTTTGELVARIRAYAEDDHERLCQGREYSCSCGYDERRDPLLSEAAEALTTLERELEEARAERDALIKSTGEHLTVRSEYLARATASQAEVERLKEALARTERNRDMWKAQVAEQAKQLDHLMSLRRLP